MRRRRLCGMRRRRLWYEEKETVRYDEISTIFTRQNSWWLRRLLAGNNGREVEGGLASSLGDWTLYAPCLQYTVGCIVCCMSYTVRYAVCRTVFNILYVTQQNVTRRLRSLFDGTLSLPVQVTRHIVVDISLMYSDISVVAGQWWVVWWELGTVITSILHCL